MISREKIIDDVAGLIAASLKTDSQAILARPDANFTDDFKMTSLHFFPLISALEEKYDADIDFAAFLTNATTLNKCADFISSVIG